MICLFCFKFLLRVFHYVLCIVIFISKFELKLLKVCSTNHLFKINCPQRIPNAKVYQHKYLKAPILHMHQCKIKNPLNTLLDMNEDIVKISQCLLPLSEFVILKIYHIKIGIRPFKFLLGMKSKDCCLLSRSLLESTNIVKLQ